MDPLKAASASAYSGLTAQSMRLRIVSENIANAESTGRTPGSDPYRRKTISFAQTMDEVTGASTVSIAEWATIPLPSSSNMIRAIPPLTPRAT